MSQAQCDASALEADRRRVDPHHVLVDRYQRLTSDQSSPSIPPDARVGKLLNRRVTVLSTEKRKSLRGDLDHDFLLKQPCRWGEVG
jgi:hypothetical protein